MDDMASERLDSVENEMEEFFDVNEVDDVDDDNPLSNKRLMINKDADFYNRRDSKAHPNQRSQSMADKEKEIEFMEKKLKPQL